MDAYWLIDEMPPARIGETQSGAAASQPDAIGSGAPFLTQIEQMLGEEAEPDTAFFMDCWTVGVDAATDSFLRRQAADARRVSEASPWQNPNFFNPYYVARADACAETAWPLRDAQGPMADRRWLGSEFEAGRLTAGEAPLAYPLTLESACRLLGVAATSTREQIRAAYRRMAGRYHPDRLARRGGVEQKLASDCMASINEAYRLLCTGMAA